MIDRQGEQAASMVARPSGGEPKQGEGVATPRQGQRQRVRDMGLKPVAQPPADPAGPRRIGRGQPALRAGQAKRVRSSPARVRAEPLAAAA